MSEPNPFNSSDPTATLGELIELLPEPCAVVDTNGVISAVNAPWRDVFFRTGLGLGIDQTCTALFHWNAATWDGVAGELHDLLAGKLDRVNFEAQAAEPPERWAAAPSPRTPPHAACSGSSPMSPAGSLPSPRRSGTTSSFATPWKASPTALQSTTPRTGSCSATSATARSTHTRPT